MSGSLSLSLPFVLLSLLFSLLDTFNPRGESTQHNGRILNVRSRRIAQKWMDFHARPKSISSLIARREHHQHHEQVKLCYNVVRISKSRFVYLSSPGRSLRPFVRIVFHIQQRRRARGRRRNHEFGLALARLLWAAAAATAAPRAPNSALAAAHISNWERYRRCDGGGGESCQLIILAV